MCFFLARHTAEYISYAVFCVLDANASGAMLYLIGHVYPKLYVEQLSKV